MKKLLILLIFVPCSLIAQKIEVNKVDDFTKNRIIRTSWSTLYNGGMSNPLWISIRVSKINGTHWLNVKLMNGNHVQSMQKDARLMLMLANDSIVTLYNSEYEISCYGCGATGFVGSSAQGIEADFVIDEDELSALQTNPIKKVRIYLTDGYSEGQLKDKFHGLLIDDIRLVDNAIASNK